MERIEDILVERDGMTMDEAKELIADAREDLQACISEGDLSGAGDICSTWFGLEPDYIMQLM